MSILRIMFFKIFSRVSEDFFGFNMMIMDLYVVLIVSGKYW